MIIIDLLDVLLNFSYLFLILMILPMIVQIIFRMIMNMVSSLLRIDLTPIVNLILFPGSLVRLTAVWFIFYLDGQEFRLRMLFPYFGRAATNMTNNFNYRGPTGLPRSRTLRIKDRPFRLSFLIFLASYSVLIFVIPLIMFHDQILLTLYFIFPTNMIESIYTFLLISLIFGGMPVPEETTTTIYTTILEYPQVTLGFILTVVGSLIITPYIGPSLGMINFMGTLVLMGLVFRYWNSRLREERGDEYFENTEDSMSLVANS